MATPSTAISRTEMSVGFNEFDLEASRRGFIGPSVLRPRVVGLQAADIANVPVEALLQDRSVDRAPSAGYSRSNFEFGTLSYTCTEKGAEEVVDDATLAIYRDILDAETVHASRAIDAVLRKFEREVAAAVYDASVWTGDYTTGITNEWDDSENATPISDVRTAARTVWARTGLWPNTLIINRRQLDALQQCDELLERVQYRGGDSPAIVTRQALAQLFGLDQVLVADAARNSATEGQDASIESIWSDEYAMVCRVATSEDMTEPCIGRTFMFGGDGPTDYTAEEIGVIVEEYREEAKRGSVIRARSWWGLKVTLKAAGQLLSNVIS